MIRRILERLVVAEERRFGVRLDHVRLLLRSSVPAFLKLALIAPVAQHRRHLDATAWHLARLAATRAEGCGACLRMAEQMAREEGVPAAVLAAFGGRGGVLSTEQHEIVAYATAVAAGAESESLRLPLSARLGEPAMVELALAIALARVFPAYKRALGFANGCEIR